MTKSIHSKMTYVGLLAASMGIGMFVSPNGSNAQAASHIKIVSSKTMDDAQPYNITHGYLYSSPKLKVRLHNGKNYVHTTFYTNKATTVKKSYGVKSVYYYVFNKSKTVYGWTWHGNLVKAKTYDQEKSDISAMIGIINTMNPISRGEYLEKLNDVDVRTAYNDPSSSSDISSIVYQIGNDLKDDPGYETIGDETLNDYQTLGKFYDLFKSRFSTFDREKLDSLYDNYQTALNKSLADDGSSDDDDQYDGGLELSEEATSAASSFGDTLSEDIAKLQE
ncbi:hypothetical protein [Lentilactobacillus buchneri]|uniref:D-alanyl-D-alanine carboxypeptidase n=1 Tax=Lentilactobacillus buchneri DSM 20057 TaxID=1423728 RepID=A0A4R5NSW8_LENBU|nr:hypothetical protein [Lentilactobacillus buchneri]WCJ52452.1 hypothetical protein OKF32_03740 [Lentilactobacillus sp. Egmn17]AEB74193.1 hypothetical protein Lbuc_1947 [Lentilactobacillus buchneri NRRL B-30929]MCT2881537.1 hypothetical protein [Lentilactobacillus buchneri]MCT2898423.1 hypothetical protein [Lentilactobacillus buchneri]MCT3252590.1 hypothetical protein [Lentilactobacillus buchneri]